MENEPFHETFICSDISTCWFSDVCIINLCFTLLLLLLVLSKICRTFVKWFSNEANCRSFYWSPKLPTVYTLTMEVYRGSMAHRLFTDFKD